jgi:hypothetical protein
MTEHTAASPGAGDDFLDLGTYGETTAAHLGDATPYASTPAEMPTGRRRWPAAGPVMWLVGGVAAGAVIVTAWHSSGSGTTTGPQGNAAATSQLPGGANGQIPGGQPPNGTQGQTGQPPLGGAQGQGGQVPFAGGFGGRSGEQHLLGTITAVGSSMLSVKTSEGTTSYPISANTQIVKNGRLASLSSLSVGDTVLLHVYPLNGKTFVERVIDGGSQGGFFGGPGGPDDQNGSTNNDQQGTTET